MLLSENGHVAEWLGSGLQNRVHRFKSGRGLANCKTKTKFLYFVAFCNFGEWPNGKASDSGSDDSRFES